MRAYLWLSWVALVAFLLGCAPPREGRRTTPPATASDAKEARAQPPTEQPQLFFWKTRSRLASAYLLGSIHVASDEIYPLDSRIERAFQQSDALVLEADLDQDALMEPMALFVEQALLPPGESVYDALDPALAERLRDRLAELGLEPERMAGFKLWFVTMALSMRALEAAGYSGEHGIDMHFFRRARGKLPVHALERSEDQLKLLMTMSDLALEQDLEMVLSGAEAEQMRTMFEQWQRGDTRGLTAQLDEMRAEYPELYADLFIKRNHVMADGVAALLEHPGTYFVVVGAGHLVGRDSVLELLERRGFPLERP